LSSRPSLEQIIRNAAKKTGADEKEILSKGKKNSRSRLRFEFCRQAVRRYGYSVRQTAAFIGVNPSSVCRAIYALEARKS
jgi:hypothetical protein